MGLRFVALFVLPLLAACGGGGSSSQFSKSFQQIESDIVSNTDEAFSIFAEDGYTDLTELPRTGDASFEGTIGLGDPGTSLFQPVIVGEMEAELDFERNALTGTAGNFFATTNSEELSGSLDLDADLDRGADTNFEFGLVGTLDGEIGADGTRFDVNLDVDADLVGDNSELIVGGAQGDLDGLPLEATFILENTD